MNHARHEHDVRASSEAVRDFDDIVIPLATDEQCVQASRCMNCGVAFCQSGVVFPGSRVSTGCPLHNPIPETNDLVYRRRWDDAADRLGLTNPFPEFTGRVCPSPCETACNLGLHDDPVTIHDNERAISDYQWERGIEPLAPAAEDAPRVSVVGSGPAGLACAWELARRGLRVRVYERDDRPGGLLMYGIPAMKLPKSVVARRVELMERSGIEFFCGIDAGACADEIAAWSDAVVLAVGSRTPRAVNVPGADLDGIIYAVDYLHEVTRALLDGDEPAIDAAGKDVVVIGGGDTGVDCVASATRQGARSVRQVIRAQCPPDSVDTVALWPNPRTVNAQAYGHRDAESVYGYDPRIYSTDTIGFEGEDGAVVSVLLKNLSYEGGRHSVAGSEHSIPAQLVLIAKGFTGPEKGVLDAFAQVDAEVLPQERIVLAGDARTGSTIVASAMADGLAVAGRIADELLAGE